MLFVCVSIGILIFMTALGFVVTYAHLYGLIPRDLALKPKPHELADFKQRLPLIGFNLAVMIIGSTFALPFFTHVFTFEGNSVSIIIGQFFLISLVDDAFFYVWHRTLHENKWLYRKVHRIHHRSHAPLPIEYIYVHPVEWWVGAIGPVSGLLLTYTTFGFVNIWAFWCFAVWRQYHELNIHSGIRSFLNQRIPFLGTTEAHSLHHARPHLGNYSSMFHFWDHIFGTHCSKKMLTQDEGINSQPS